VDIVDFSGCIRKVEMGYKIYCSLCGRTYVCDYSFFDESILKFEEMGWIQVMSNEWFCRRCKHLLDKKFIKEKYHAEK